MQAFYDSHIPLCHSSDSQQSFLPICHTALEKGLRGLGRRGTEGQVWEACMFASHYKPDNLCVVVDNNGLQIDAHGFDQIEAAFTQTPATR